MTKKTRTQIIQFSFIGVSNAVVDIGSLNLLLLLWPTQDSSLMLLLFNTISYTLAILNSYIWNTKFTFNHTVEFNYTEKGMYLLQALVALIISNVVFISCFKLLGNVDFISTFINQNVSKGAAMFLSSSASFLFLKFWVFRKSKKKK